MDYFRLICRAALHLNDVTRSRPGRRVRGVRVLQSILLLSIAATSGCQSVDYLLSLAAGQVGVLINARPVETVLDGDALTDDERSKLELVAAVRQYAVDVIGLEAQDSFTTFLDLGGQPAAYNLSASAKHALSPVTWSFPIVGVVPYLGFFDRPRAEAVQQSLIEAAYDTVLFEVDAFSTLGVFPDPVRSPMLSRSDISLTDTVIHELTHNTIWRPGDVAFNESLATFVGRSGALQFLADRDGDDAPILDQARRRFEDTNRYSEFLAELRDELEAFYAGPGTIDEKIAGREAIFEAARERFADEVLPGFNDPEAYAGLEDLPTNNAWILANQRYNSDLDVFEQILAVNGGKWPATLEVFTEAAVEDNPIEFLRQWFTEHEVPRAPGGGDDQP